MTSYSVIGKSATRPDAYDKVTGGVNFPVNVMLPGMLHGKLLRSIYAHANVKKIDTSAAEKLPGVKALITYADVPQKVITPVYYVATDGVNPVQDWTIMSDRVRYSGQPIAAVAATSVDIAERALELIEVEYEELPAVFDPQQALSEDAPLIHENAPGNVAKRIVFEDGDLEKGFAEADHIFENTYQTQRVHTCYMEPRVCVVNCDARGNYTVHSSMQHLHGLREKLAVLLDVPEGKITVIKPFYIGGGFGGKLDIGYIEPVAAILSKKTGRPVRIEHTRHEDFITTARNPINVYLKTGVSKDGLFTARYARSTLDAGSYATHGSLVIDVHSSFGVFFSYLCPNRKLDGISVYTNNMVGGGYRGYGGPQGCFAVESQIDEICEELGFDKLAFRHRNAIGEGSPHPLAMWGEWGIETHQLEACLQQGAERFGWSDRKPANDDSGNIKRGVGMSCHPLWVSGCLGTPDIYEHSGAIIKLNPDGSADLASGTIDIGSGQITTLCQIAAEELGLPVEAVRMTELADSNNVPFDAPTHASRVTYSAGSAVKAAATQAKQRMKEVAATVLEANIDDLEVRDGFVSVKGTDVQLAVADIVKRAESPYVKMTTEGPAKTTRAEKGTIYGVANQPAPANASPAGAQFVEVEVDTDTGQVKVLRVVYAHDLGRLIHPLAAEGQVEGAFQQAMGYALMEEMQFDQDSGACLTSDFLDYKMPTALEMPPSIESIFIESNEPSGPFGAKSLSELCIIVPAPAIANAIYNATGVRIRELPITPEKILKALGKI